MLNKNSDLTQVVEIPELNRLLQDWSSTLIRLTMHEFTRSIRANGLSMTQMSILMYLHFRGPSEVMGLCELMQVSAAAASQMVERLVQQGVVYRSSSPNDRRVRLVNLTDRGRQAVLSSITAQQSWVQSITARLTDEEMDKSAEVLQLLAEHAAQVEEENNNHR